MSDKNTEEVISIEHEMTEEEFSVWEYQMQVKEARSEVIAMLQNNWIEEFDTYGDDAIHSKSWHYSIWFASTQMLPNLEVQVVIDANNRAYISSGTAGYVDFPIPPKGLTLPIKCWFHTHPFGSAYFSGTDWRTVSIWEDNMKTAYVIGGDEHYGFWEQYIPNMLNIKEKDGTNRIQIKQGSEEE